jgi:hypothetical protein
VDFFHNRCARVSERASRDPGKGQHFSLLLVIGKLETESRSYVASLLKTESNGPILPSAVINWYNSFFEPGTAPFPESDDEQKKAALNKWFRAALEKSIPIN